MTLPSRSRRIALAFLAAAFFAVGAPWSLAAEPPKAAGPASAGFVQEELIGADRFRAEHPEYDGRGVTIAVFDTGVDPAALGMQTTPQGERKVVDVLDCTGAGDLELTKVEKPTEPKLRGLTGRTLTLPPELLTKASELRIGYRHAERFFPGGTFRRVMEDRKKRLDAAIREEALARGEHEEGVPSEKPADEPREEEDAKELDEKAKDEEKQARERARKSAREKVVDAGPVYDCVALKLEDGWRALVDTDEDGDLAEEKLLAPFAVAGDYVVLPRPADLTLAVQIARDGSSMTLVTVEGSHGTHCAGIAAAYVPERSYLDGVAPGARILSCKIGDSSLNGMETPLALSRAFDAAVAYGVDVVSMSYGEPVLHPDRGWLVAEARRLAEEKGIVYVAAAANEGPGISTVGAPGGTTQGILGVGAYLSPEMRTWLQGQTAREGGTLFGFSSRGPAFNGDVGVDILAPGAAKASVPLDEDQDLQYMNGTSMATPHVSGAVALLLSGMKAEKLSWTPAFVERALKASAVSQRSEFEPTNAGLLDLPGAWKAMTAYASVAELQRTWKVRKASDGEVAGIYLRDVAGLGPIHLDRFVVSPVGHVADDFAVGLRLAPSADWITVPTVGVATNEGLTFEVEVSLKNLTPGVHAESIDLFDASSDAPLPLATLAVTVIVPDANLAAGESSEATRSLAFGFPARTFFAVDAASEGVWVTIAAKDAPKRSVVRAEIVQRPTRPGESVHVARWAADLDDATQAPRFVALRPGELAELVITSGTPHREPLSLDLTVAATPFAEAPREIVLPASTGQTLVDVAAGEETLHVSASARLDRWFGAWSPKKADIDRLPPMEFANDKSSRSTLERLRLTYEFSVTTKTNVTLQFAPEQQSIYDHPAGGWTYELFDEQGRRAKRGDYRPVDAELSPGKYRVDVTGYSTSKADLEKLRDVPLEWTVAYDGAKNVGLQPSGERTIDPRSIRRFELSPTKVEKQAPLAGAIGIEGELEWTFAVDRDGRRREWTETTRLVRPYAGSTESDDEDELKIVWSSKPSEPERNRAETLIRWLADVPADKRDAFDRTYDALIAEYSGEPFLLQLRLQWLDQESVRKERLDETIAAADALLATIDQPALREALAARSLGSKAGGADRELVDWRKAAVIDALYRKGRAIGYRELPEVVKERPIEDQAALDKAFRENLDELARWIDLESAETYLLKLRDLRRESKFGAAAELLQKRASDDVGFWPAWKRFEIYDSLGWTPEREMARSDLLERFPKRAAEELKE